MKIGSQKFGDEVTVVVSLYHPPLLQIRGAYMSSKGEMKISLKLIIYAVSASKLDSLFFFDVIRTFSWRRCLRSFSSR